MFEDGEEDMEEFWFRDLAEWGRSVLRRGCSVQITPDDVDSGLKEEETKPIAAEDVSEIDRRMHEFTIVEVHA
ncbi:hypothetical protein F2Q70_00017501 [Brassica cretica]|uniref:Uncharacterized protein n=1 Tax=Brassica cretica TaxID=69181 RepID=A0A8S9HYK6_BRACR|nr:hypothetical protein F2Q70_00017501 [Brassica cretica]KAF2595857.1 hypothetical protein F2Q68_00010454 [Brassica cretica]